MLIATAKLVTRRRSVSWQLEVDWFQIKFTTTKFNTFLRNLGSSNPGLWQKWFSVGAILGIVLLVLAPAVLALNLLQGIVQIVMTVTYDPLADAPQQAAAETGSSVLRPIVPGVTVPLTHIVYFFLCILINGVFHEMAHGISAASENIRVNQCGGFLTLAYPGAFVELNTDQLTKAEPFQRLRIFSAGVFHNTVLCLLGLAALGILPSK